MGNKREFADEVERLERTMDRLERIEARLTREIGTHRDKMGKMYVLRNDDDYRSDNPGIVGEVLVAEQIADILTRELDAVKKAAVNPYFGKITYSDDGVTVGDSPESPQLNSVYIGKRGVYDSEACEPVVTDWRAPAAGLYYSGKIGRTKYRLPSGEVEVSLLERRAIKIRDGILRDVYDSDGAVGDDELLIEYLSQNKGAVLNEIIATIRAGQNEIIRSSPRRNLIVQGAAGSGKTTVAVHRISYILFAHSDTLSSENVYLIASSPLFLGYISAMLPDLDVPSVKQYTVRQIIADELGELTHQRPDVCGTARQAFLGDDFPERFGGFFRQFEEKFFGGEDITCFGIELAPGYEIKNALGKRTMTTIEKAGLIDRAIMANLNSNRKIITERILGSGGAEIFGGIPPTKQAAGAHYARLIRYYSEYFARRLRALDVSALAEDFARGDRCRVIYRYDPAEADADYGAKNHSGRAGDVYTNETSRAEIPPEEAAFMLSVNFRIFGSGYGYIKHIVIDEAQDLNMAVFYLLRIMFPEAVFTIVGDVTQNVGTDGLHSWVPLCRLLGAAAKYTELDISYRNTWEISTFAAERYRELSGCDLPHKPFERHGDRVRSVSCANHTEKINTAAELIAELRGRGRNLSAVICKTPIEADALYTSLSKICEGLTRLDLNCGKLQQGEYILDAASAKGLEFDAVILWDYENYSPENAKLLYVAATRALHELILMLG